ncbi:phosphotransferase [Lentzea albidocapillata]|uniref:phosphotransferase n=1 Tax=Lentzea albidocapillata TaxID=40571 RepID=UPI001FE353BD|nr:phosphotransferase [Lentzea albidocapillata]
MGAAPRRARAAVLPRHQQVPRGHRQPDARPALPRLGRLKRIDESSRHGPLRWVHADLHRGNLLFTDGELTGVIDWGCAAAGDPAGDLMTAWLFLDERGRAQFRRELTEFDDATWVRARGWALELSVLALARRGDSNSFVAGIARHTLAQLLAG